MALALALSPAVAFASPVKVVHAPLESTAPIEPQVRAELEQAVDEGLRRAGITAVTLADPDGCTTAACLGALARRGDAGWTLRVELRAADRNFELALALHEAGAGALARSSTATCELCGTAELAQRLADAVATLAAKLTEAPPAPAHLRITSDPTAASVRVDGREHGRTPLRLELAPGRHRVELSKPGYLGTARMIEAIAGVDGNLTLSLARARRRLLAAGGAVLGVGVVATATGAALWAVDERPYRGRCSGDDVDFAGRCRFRLDTAAAGIALTSIGVAALVAGIAMMAADRRRR
ncbi:MAG: PEGA domain-containing protein [Nannocystaceae bacterium]